MRGKRNSIGTGPNSITARADSLNRLFPSVVPIVLWIPPDPSYPRIGSVPERCAPTANDPQARRSSSTAPEFSESDGLRALRPKDWQKHQMYLDPSIPLYDPKSRISSGTRSRRHPGSCPGHQKIPPRTILPSPTELGARLVFGEWVLSMSR